MSKSWIEEANNRVDIADVLSDAGVFIPHSIREGSNKKIHCPFGFYHSDGGQTKAMRLYVTSNTAYCFSCMKRYSPVGLAATVWECKWEAAAWRLLEASGFKPKSLEERWVEATTPEVEAPDILSLAEALKIYCSRLDPSWQMRQFDSAISQKLGRCLALLDAVKTENDAQLWLTMTKQAMAHVLTTDVSSDSLVTS